MSSDTKHSKQSNIQEGEIPEVVEKNGNENQATPDLNTQAYKETKDYEALLKENMHLKSENQELKEAREQQHNEYQYLQASKINMIRQHARELEQSNLSTEIKVIKEFLLLLDSLEAERALTSEENSKQGVGSQNIFNLLSNIFKSLGVMAIHPAVEENFDPHVHEAVGIEAVEEGSTQAMNTILKVLRKGYRLKERMIRPAMVIVSGDKN